MQYHTRRHAATIKPFNPVAMQMYGPNVAPLTVGKQNLIVHVLRQLEQHFFVVNQFFRLDDCSHNVEKQQASITLTIVTHTEITDVGLDTMSNCYALTSDRTPANVHGSVFGILQARNAGTLHC